MRSPLISTQLPFGIGRHVSGVADPEFRYLVLQRSDGWIETTWNNMSDPGASAVAGPEEQEGGEPPPIRARVRSSA
jgi:hypothetical protein